MNKTGIIGAMELEVATLKNLMTVDTITTKAGMDFYDGTLEGRSIVVVRLSLIHI